jgi:hypothetical protein
LDDGRSKFGSLSDCSDVGRIKMGNDLPEKYGGYCGGSLGSSGESFDPSRQSVNEK